MLFRSKERYRRGPLMSDSVRMNLSLSGENGGRTVSGCGLRDRRSCLLRRIFICSRRQGRRIHAAKKGTGKNGRICRICAGFFRRISGGCWKIRGCRITCSFGRSSCCCCLRYSYADSLNCYHFANHLTKFTVSFWGIML